MQKTISIILFFIGFFSGFSQAIDSVSPTSLRGNLDKQFEFVFQKSNNFQEYKVVKKDHLLHLKKSSMDSVNRYKKELSEVKTRIIVHNAERDTLKYKLDNANESLEILQKEKDSIFILGIQLSKPLYNFIMMGIIGVLLFVLVILVLRFKQSYRLAKDSESNYLKLEEDFEDFKRKSMEKEQQLGRKLQDEINRQKKTGK